MRHLRNFEYHEPSTLEETSALLMKHGKEAKILAGGTDLLLKMKTGTIVSRHLINLKTVRDERLSAIGTDDSGALKLGALTTLQSVFDSPLLKERAEILVDTAAKMGSHQLRNIATIGGNLCNAAPSADMAPPLIALNTNLKIYSSRGERSIELENFFHNPGETDLKQDEILVEINIPKTNPSAQVVYEKFAARNAMVPATVGVAILMIQNNYFCKDVKIILGAVAPTPIRAKRAEKVLLGKKINKTMVKETAETASEEAIPINDIRASAKYRRGLINSIVYKTIERIISK